MALSRSVKTSLQSPTTPFLKKEAESSSPCLRLEAARPQAALYDPDLATGPEELEDPPEDGGGVEEEIFVPDLQVSVAVEDFPVVVAFPDPVLPPAGQLGQPLPREDRTPLGEEPLPVFGVIVADPELLWCEVEDALFPIFGQTPPVVHRRDSHVPAIPDDVDYPGIGIDLVYLVQVLGMLGALVPHYPPSRTGDLFGEEVVDREPREVPQVLVVTIRPQVPRQRVPGLQLPGDREGAG